MTATTMLERTGIISMIWQVVEPVETTAIANIPSRLFRHKVCGRFDRLNDRVYPQDSWEA